MSNINKIEVAVRSGIKRHIEYMHRASDLEELEIAYYAAKAYIAGCNDSETLTHEQWREEFNFINDTYTHIKSPILFDEGDK